MSDEKLTVMINGHLPLDVIVREVAAALARDIRQELQHLIAAEMKVWISEGLRHIDLAPIVRDAAKEVVNQRLPITNFQGLGFVELVSEALREHLEEKLRK